MKRARTEKVSKAIQKSKLKKVKEQALERLKRKGTDVGTGRDQARDSALTQTEDADRHEDL